MYSLKCAIPFESCHVLKKSMKYLQVHYFYPFGPGRDILLMQFVSNCFTLKTKCQRIYKAMWLIKWLINSCSPYGSS